LGNGDGTFQAPVSSIPSDAPIAAADVNGDGKLDLIMETDPSIAQIYLGNGDGTFSDTSNYVLNIPGPRGVVLVTGIAIADFNLDGKLDIALGGSVQLGNGNGTFQGIPLGVVPTYPNAIAIGDFEKKGTPDVAVLSTQDVSGTNAYILRNDGTGKLSLINTYALQDSGFEIVTADFNGDGNLDLVVIGYDPTTQDWGYSVLLGNGNGTFQSPVFYPQNVTGGGAAFVADFNHDGKLDLAVSDGQSVAILLGNGDGTFAAPVLYFDGGGGGLVTADFNGDGKLDLAAGSPTALLFGNGDGTFQPAVFPTNLNNFVPALTADFNNDGKPDLLSYNQVALGNGNGTFTLLPAFSNPWVAVGDLNGDGRLDLIVDVYNGSGVELGNGDGTFGSVIPILAPGNIVPGFPSGTTYVADMNGDGHPDLIFIPLNSGLGSTVSGVAVLLNTTSPGFGLSATALSPSTVTAGSSATSTVTVTSTFGFAGTVSLSCAITPAVTPAPTCSLSSKSVQISGSGTQTVTVEVGTTAPVTAFAAPHVTLPAGPMPLAWTLMFLGSAWLWVRNRKRLPALAAPIVVLAFVFTAGCGGSGSSSTNTTHGTPAGTYAVTITASSGNVSHNMALQVVVQ
jgi:FG-GAP-like repeat